MADEMVLDAPVLDDVIDEPIQDDPAEGEGAEDRHEDDATATQTAAEVKGDERLIKQAWRDLKATHPQLFSEYKGLFFGKKDLDAKLEGFDVDGTKSWLEEKGGRESLESAFSELEAKATELDGINEAIAAASPDLIREIAELHPESFGKLAVTTLNEWSAREPEAYSQAISGAIAQVFAHNRIDSDMDRTSFYLENLGQVLNAIPGVAQNPQVVSTFTKLLEQVGKLDTFTKSFGQAAAKAPAMQQPKNDAVSQREQTVAQREQRIYNDNYLGKLDAQRKPMIEEALKDYIAQRPDSTGTKDRAIKAAIESIEATLGNDQSFVRSVQAFHAKGDADGALRLVKSREARVVAEIAKAVGEDFYGKLGAKAVTKPGAKPGQQQQRKPAQPSTIKDERQSIMERIAAR